VRTGSELNQATRPFAVEDRAKSWRLLITTLLVLGGTLSATVFAPHWGLQLAASLVAALVVVRLFIFYHDYRHGAILHGSRAGSAMMTVFGWYFLAVRSVWRETHNYHHKHNAKLIGSSIGSYPVVTVGMWRGMNAQQRLAYRVTRHPLTILFGYFLLFLIGMTVSPFRRDPKKHWAGPPAALVHLALFVLAGLSLGWLTALFLVVLPMFVAHAAGSYLFYAQHNFPDAQLRDRRAWDYTFAALRSSSYFVMNPVMHWFTGNIGYHHVHHLNHRIPFYRLPEAMAAIPELQDPGRTSWRPSDVAACLRLALWDPERGRMISFDELDQAPAEVATA
jgi:acyl-lipid omega-6 desaturase (Delta-12 desaturase)